jgi:hypothetical protein
MDLVDSIAARQISDKALNACVSRVRQFRQQNRNIEPKAVYGFRWYRQCHVHPFRLMTPSKLRRCRHRVRERFIFADVPMQ